MKNHLNFTYNIFNKEGDILNYNIYLKCEVCGAVTRVRIQAGWLDRHPIRFNCGKCGILIPGICELDQSKGKIGTYFENAEPCNDPESFYIESSGELITLKLGITKHNEFFLPPYFNSMNNMGDDMETFKNNIVYFLNNTKENWNRCRRIFDLEKNNKYMYLRQEIHKLIPKRLYPCDSNLERLRAVHFLIFINFNIFHDKEFTSKTFKEINEGILKLDRAKLKLLIKYYKDNNDMLARYSEKIYDILNEFVRIFQFLIPAYGLTFYRDKEIDYKDYGTTTCSFEDIKQFYLDAYEVIGDLILVPIALNNILYRGDFEKINEELISSNRVKNYKDLFNAPKGKRSELIDLNELFCKVTGIKLNNKLRNAIGHNDYSYDGITQIITYIPNSSQPEKYKNIYLLEFSLECIELIKGIVVLDEIIYRVRQFQYMMDGEIPKIRCKDIIKKVGRNELCPCGSGKKYKRCHGK